MTPFASAPQSVFDRLAAGCSLRRPLYAALGLLAVLGCGSKGGTADTAGAGSMPVVGPLTGAPVPSSNTSAGNSGAVASSPSGSMSARPEVSGLPQPPVGTAASAPNPSLSAPSASVTAAPSSSSTVPSNTGGAGGMGPLPELPRGPTPPANGANFPFPQNREMSHCTYPTRYDNEHVVAAFNKWKTDTVTSDGAGGFLRVKRPNEPGLEPNSTVSEGIAYGMLIAVYMNEQAMFDAFWQYSQLWLTENGLMHWYINAAGTEVLGAGAASDADIDIAWSLIMADKQWGGSGSLGDTYANIARSMVDRVWQHEVQDGKLLLPGDGWGDWNSANVSYFMPNYFRTFADFTGNAEWHNAVVTSYDILEKSLNEANGNTTNGLVPAWCTSEGVPNAGVWMDNSAPTHYQYDSCRTPFRIGIDYCLHGEPRAQAYVQKTSNFFSGVGVANIVDGYDLNGNPRPQESGGQSAAFIGPAAVGAMHTPDQQAFLDEAYAAVAGLDLLVGGTYYEESWTVLSLLMLTGNFLDYTRIEPAQ